MRNLFAKVQKYFAGILMGLLVKAQAALIERMRRCKAALIAGYERILKIIVLFVLWCWNVPVRIRAKRREIWEDWKRQYFEVRANAKDGEMPGLFETVREAAGRTAAMATLSLWPILLDGLMNGVPDAETVSVLGSVVFSVLLVVLLGVFFGSIWWFQAVTIADDHKYRKALFQTLVLIAALSVLAPVFKMMPVWTHVGKMSLMSLTTCVFLPVFFGAVFTLAGVRICYWCWRFYQWVQRKLEARRVHCLAVDDVSGWSIAIVEKKDCD